MTAREDAHWPRASDWLRGAATIAEGVSERRLAVLGAPVNAGSVTPGRCDLGPGAIRAGLRRFSTFRIEGGIDVRRLRVRDHGDAAVGGRSLEECFEPLRDSVRVALADGTDALVLLGGNDGVTRAGVHGCGPELRDAGLLTLDAHFDLRGLEHGLSNGNPVRALLADGLPGSRIVQLGVQSFANSPAHAAVAREHGITVRSADEVRAEGVAAAVERALDELAGRCSAVYVDVDLDVLDRAHAPATPGARPGGLMPSELRQAVARCGQHPAVRALGVVELDPQNDVAETTTLAAGACLLEFAAGLLLRE